MTEWIPVEERLPEKEGKYLVIIEPNVLFNTTELFAFFEQSKWILKVNQGYMEGVRVTHWAPLPEMPKKKRWMPKKREQVYGIKSTGKVLSGPWADIDVDNEARNFLGAYKTRDEAEQMLEKIKKFVESEIGEA